MQNDIIKPPTNPTDLSGQPSQMPENTNSPVYQQPVQNQQLASPAQPQPADLVESTATSLSAAAKPKRRKPVAAMFAAIIVFVGLAGGTFYMTILDQKANQPEVATTQTPAGQNTATDASSDIDSALNEASQLPTSNEDPAKDLSDQNLGL